MIRFSLQQLLLLIVLAAIFGGYLTSASSRPFNFIVTDVAVSSDGGRLLCAGPQGVQLVDLGSGSSRLVRLNSENAPMIFEAGTDLKACFVDEDTFAVVSDSSGQELTLYSFSKGEAIRQTMVMPRFTQGSADVQLGKHYAAFWGDRTYSFYEMSSGRRIPFHRDLNARVEWCSTNPSGKFALMRLEAGGDRVFAFIDLEKGTVQQQWGDYLSGEGYRYGAWLNDDGSRALIVSMNAYALVDTGDGSLIHRSGFVDTTGGSNVSLSDDGRTFSIVGSIETPVMVTIDAVTGETLRTVELSISSSEGSGLRSSPVCFSPDAKKLYIANPMSDAGVVVYDTETGKSISKAGRFPRLLLPILFTGLFLAWAAVWGYSERRSRARAEQEKQQATDETPDPFADEPEIVEAVEVEQPARKLPWWMRNIESSLTSIRVLMGFGGVVAILLAIVPSYLRHDPRFYFFTPTDFVSLLQIWTIYGLIVGVWAVAAAFAGSRKLLRTVAALQILNLVNCDVINGIMGIVETVMLNMPVLRRFLDGPDNQ
ncbi:MAG: hypothetical protein AAF456_07560 [Planctomycetota bacterium]